MRFSFRSPLLVLSAALLATACSRLTAPVDDRVTPLLEQAPPPPASVAAPAPPPAAPTPAPTPVAPPEPSVRAAHILISFKGAKMSDAKVTRTKEEAKKLATDLAKKAKGAKADGFGALAKKFSDDKGSAQNGGDLGEFTRPRMVKPFSDAAFALKPGEVSPVVESDFGFHVIRRAP